MRAANDNGAAVSAAGAEPLRFLSVCSGIEAASVAWPDWQAVAFSEIEKFPSAVLAHHYPDVPNLGDFTAIDTTSLGRVDILCGGTPCQAFSVAGLRWSLDDARGNLSLEFVRLAHELAGNGATAGNGLRNAVWENVLGVLNTKDNAFGCFLGGLVGADDALVPSEKPADGKSSRHWKWRKGGKYPILNDVGEETGEYATVEPWHALTWPNAGMVSGPKGRAAWCVLDAQHFGLAQRRKRVILVADFGNGADPAAVLFERKGLHGYSPARRKKREGIALPTGVSAAISSGQGWWSESAVGAPVRAQETPKDSTVIAYAPEIARCVATREGSSQDYETTTMVVSQQMYSIMPQNSGKDYKARPVEVAQPLMAGGPVGGNQGGDVICVTGQISHALKAEGADASEDGTGRGTPIVSVLRGHSDYGPGVPSLRANGGDAGGGSEAIICFSAKDYGADAANDIAPTLRAGGHSTSHANAGVMPEIAYRIAGDGAAYDEGDTTAPLTTGTDPSSNVVAFDTTQITKAHSHAVQVGSAVRRLTPRECERLMGFPDDYTLIPYRNKPATDGPRYKALGNSWAVPLFAWLGSRVAANMPVLADNDDDSTGERQPPLSPPNSP